MQNELHIQLKPDVFELPEDILSGFPFLTGQSIASASNFMIVIDLGDEEDTNYEQDWYLNSNEAVESYFVLGD